MSMQGNERVGKKKPTKKNKKQTRIQSVFLLTITVKLSFKKQTKKKHDFIDFFSCLLKEVFFPFKVPVSVGFVCHLRKIIQGANQSGIFDIFNRNGQV